MLSEIIAAKLAVIVKVPRFGVSYTFYAILTHDCLRGSIRLIDLCCVGTTQFVQMDGYVVDIVMHDSNISKGDSYR